MPKPQYTDPSLHTHSAPEGYNLRGVSTLLDSKGRVKQTWVKTARQPLDPGALAKLYSDACKDLKTARTRVRQTPPTTTSDLCVVYPLGDPHFGMLAWYREAGKSWDLKIAAQTHMDVVSQLVAHAPASDVAVLANLGDLIHADGYKGQTYNGTPVDTDGRWPKILRAACTSMIGMTEHLLTKHGCVQVQNVRGNHDEQSSVVVAEIMRAHFRTEPRVRIESNIRVHTYARFGANLFGFTHGDKTKGDALPLVMATDQPVLWGEARHRKWFCGHVHHQSVKEHPGCTVETYRTLAPQDAWHAGQGYRAQQSAKCEVYHVERGRVTTHEVVL